MTTTGSLQIQVLNYANRPIEGARVSAGQAFAYTDAKGRAQLEVAEELDIQVDARGYESQTRLISYREAGRKQFFTLGRPGMPYYYRGKVKVPFEPLPGTIGILAKPVDKQKQKKKRSTQEEETAAPAKHKGDKTIRSGKNFERSGIVVVQVDEDNDEELAKRLLEMEKDPSVEAVGAVVRLSEDHASFLTNVVIARFEADVDEVAVSTIAARHGLTPEGRFEPLGNVHRLRFSGPATYAVLDAANALAEENDVIWAEPDLASTSEEDAIIPTDFLFREQWDHQLIDTPDAWQALRDMNAARTFGNPDIVIAVVDSGIDDTHPELSGTVSNGNAKQVALFDFVNMVANMNNLDGDHGTACASAATANINNASVVAGINEGIAGIAGNCRLIGIRRGGTEARYADMYLWAAGFNVTTAGFPAQLTRGADVITNSFGFSVNNPISGLMSDTFDRLTDDGRGGRGVLLFFSAGNDNVDLDTTFRRPWSMYERCFGVAASTLANDGVTEVKAGYSNFGSTVDWCAPSDDDQNFGGDVHNPPGVFGAHSATIEDDPAGDAIPGHPAQQTTLAVAVAPGATLLTLTSTAGFTVGQAILAGVQGTGVASGRRITAVNAGANQITLNEGLSDALPIGAPVVAGPRSYRTNFGGTSYATPVSAGTGALMLSANPELHWDEVRDIIRRTAVKIDPNNTNAVGRWRDINNRISTDPAYLGPNFSEFYGFGRLNTSAAVQAAGWQIELMTPALNFNDIPEGETTVRAVRFDVQSLWEVNFTIIAGPGAPFTTPLGTSVASAGTPSSDTVREVILWVAYTGTTAGATATGSVTVRNTQTGREWTIPITANTVTRQTACVMLCLDRSGSMLANSGIGTAKRIDVLRFSAEIMLDVVHEGDGVGIVSFDHDAYNVQVPPIGPLGSVSIFDPQRDMLRGLITSFDANPSGLTAIGDGLERSQLGLAPVSGFDTKSVVVFTDGYETDPKYISDVASSITDRVFAVGLGRAEHIQPTALTALTNGTGGFCVLTGDLDINSRYKLAKYFLQVLAGVKNEDIVRDPDGLLAYGQVHEIDFRLTEADIAADIILMTPGRGLIDMTLVTPDGNVIDQTQALAMPGGLYYDGRNVSYYRLTLPAPVGSGAREGRWLARLELNGRGFGRTHIHGFEERATAIAAVAQHGLPYSLLVHSYSNLKMTTTLSQSGFIPGANLLLRAVLTEYGIPVEQRALLSAVVIDPGGVQRTVQLLETQPGVFECSIPTSLPGTYELRITARGRTLRNRLFTREAVRTGAVWIGGERPAPSSSDPGRADDLLCRLLSCLSSGRVIRPELRERLESYGLDLNALLKCAGASCKPSSKHTGRYGVLEERLIQAIRAELTATHD